MEKMSLYTAGIADFEKIRQSNRIYVDKTDLIYKMTKESGFIFLSRPRRFGKSLLCSTLKYYFQGRKDLFEGLAMAHLETEWKQYPVLHFDMSKCKNGHDVKGVRMGIEKQLENYEVLYGRDEKESTMGMRLTGLIERAHNKTGLRTVVIIDEYDAPLLAYYNTADYNESRRILLEFTTPLKCNDADEQFVFITGITELPYEPTVNNFSRLSDTYQCASICGFTHEEMLSVFEKEILCLAEKNNCSRDEIIEQLHLRYGGYQFDTDELNVYNPYCLMKTFETQQMGKYWATNEMVTSLKEQLQRFNDNGWRNFSEMAMDSSLFYKPLDENSPFSFLYENGVFTIKSARRYNFHYQYTIGFPNTEAKEAFSKIAS